VSYRCSKQANGNTGCTDYRLLRSSLGDDHWTSTPIPNGRGYPWGYMGNVAAFGAHVWLTEGAKWSLLITSSDRGRTFRIRSDAHLISSAGCFLTADSVRALWAECPGGMESRFMYSRDAGTTWTEVPAGQWNGTGGGYFDPVSSDLAFLDYGQRSGAFTLYRITNFGRRLTGVADWRCSSVSALVFVNSSKGLALCNTFPAAQLEITSDGGRTWSHVVIY
jgi:hypothetical protein